MTSPRARDTAYYLSLLLGFAKSRGCAPDEIAKWASTQVAGCGYYEIQGRPSAAEFAEAFAEGRRQLYEEVATRELSQSFQVKSRIWYENDPPQAFFFFDICTADVRSYGRALALAHAANVGHKLEIQYVDGYEVAHIYK